MAAPMVPKGGSGSGNEVWQGGACLVMAAHEVVPELVRQQDRHQAGRVRPSC